MEELLTESCLKPYHDKSQCIIVSCTDGTFGVLDEGIQTLAVSGTQEECEDYLGVYKPTIYDEEWLPWE